MSGCAGVTGYANGGGPAGRGGAAAGVGGVDGGLVFVELLPSDGGDAGVVGMVVFPAPPSGGAGGRDEVVVVVVVVDVVLSPAAAGVCGVTSVGWPTQAIVTTLIATITPAPASAASTLSRRSCTFTPTRDFDALPAVRPRAHRDVNH